MKLSFILLILSFVINGQIKYNFKTFENDSKKLIESPLKWNLYDAGVLTSLTLGTYILMNMDDEVKRINQTNFTPHNSLLMEFSKYYGEPLFTSLIGLYFLASSDNTQNKRLGFEILQSFIYTGITTTIFKISFGRARPSEVEKSDVYEPFSFKGSEYSSFLSGHTSIAFSLSTVISENIQNDLLKYVIYIPAILTGISRIYHNRHWLSDVFAGAALGILIGKYVHNLHNLDSIASPEPAQIIEFSLLLN